MPEPTISISEAARRSGVPESTLKRWAEQRVLPVRGGWTAAAASQARIVARMRERGHSLREIRGAVRDGRLAFGSVEDLLPPTERTLTRAEAAEAVGLEEDLIERIMGLLGTPMELTDRVSDRRRRGAARARRRSSARASRSSRCSSSSGSTRSRFARSPRRRCGSSTCSSTSR